MGKLMTSSIIEILSRMCFERTISKNPKFEYRNPKQIRNTNDQILETYAFVLYFVLVTLGFVSNFGFRASNLCFDFGSIVAPLSNGTLFTKWLPCVAGPSAVPDEEI